MAEFNKWKKHNEVPPYRRLDYQFDIDSLRRDLEIFKERQKEWDGLSSDYGGLCRSHTGLPKMFFATEELEKVSCLSEVEWSKASYAQMSLTEFDDGFSLKDRTTKSQSHWDRRIAKNDPAADERWYRRVKESVPPYLKEVLNTFEGFHRSRIARLAPHSEIKPHVDYDTTYSLRVHIPIQTNDGCRNFFILNDQREEVHFPADGSAWLINPGILHGAYNSGSEFRDHLIISVDSQELL